MKINEKYTAMQAPDHRAIQERMVTSMALLGS